MAETVRAPRYLTRFVCIADRCEDTCCTLRVSLTAGDLVRLRATASTRAEEQDVERHLEPHEDGFRLAVVADGGCGFLDERRLCSLQTAHGEGALPDACALFPRTLSRLPDRIELTATLSCPEAARLCLLAPDAMEWGDAPETLQRVPPKPPSPTDPYDALSGPVRVRGEEILADMTLTLGERVSRLALLGAELEPTYFRGCDRDGAEAAIDKALSAEPRERQAPGSAWQDAFAFALGVLYSLNEGQPPRLNAILSAATEQLQHVARAIDPAFGTPSGPPLMRSLGSAMLQLRERSDSALGTRLDSALSRYLLNEWRREWFTRSPSLLAHAFKLGLQLACIRLLLIAHPALVQLAEHVTGGGALNLEGEQVIQLCLVDAVQIFTRSFERRPDAVAAIMGVPPQTMGTDALGRALAFARLC